MVHGGIVGITLNEHAPCRWALSLHICSRLTKDIADLKEATLFEVATTKKEESTSRIKADSDDRNAIRDKLETCVDPLDVSQGQNLINIVTGKISNKNVNVEDAVQIGKAQLQEFESACPTGFYQTIKMKVITMKEGKKQRGADPMEQCDSGLIFARVTALMSTRAINLNDVMKNELAAVLTSIFDEKRGELRISKSTSILKRRLQVEVTNPSRGTGHAVVIDGCAILWVLRWPSKGIIKGAVLNFVKYATNKMHCYRRTHVIFDRYKTSIKDAIRRQRACEATREYKLTMNAPLPQQQVVLSVMKNKVQLIDLICEELQQLDDVPLNTSFVIKERTPVPTEVRSDALVQRFDDTDVFVLLAHYFAEESL